MFASFRSRWLIPALAIAAAGSLLVLGSGEAVGGFNVPSGVDPGFARVAAGLDSGSLECETIIVIIICHIEGTVTSSGNNHLSGQTCNGCGTFDWGTQFNGTWAVQGTSFPPQYSASVVNDTASVGGWPFPPTMDRIHIDHYYTVGGCSVTAGASIGDPHSSTAQLAGTTDTNQINVQNDFTNQVSASATTSGVYFHSFCLWSLDEQVITSSTHGNSAFNVGANWHDGF